MEGLWSLTELKNLDVDGKVVSKWILHKQGVWVRMETSGGFLKHGYVRSNYTKMRGNFWPAERLLSN